MAKLKLCPFCGGQAYMERWEMAPFEEKHILEENDGFFYGVVCISCDASSGSKLCEEEAITAWNRRADANSLTEVLKRNTTEIVEKANGIYAEYIRYLQEKNKALDEELASLRNEADAWNRRVGEDR